MAGELTILEEHRLYWVWHRLGPVHSGVQYGRRFTDGRLPAPVSGKEARDWVSRGYSVAEWENETWWSGWDRSDDGAWVPRFARIEFVIPGVIRRRRRGSDQEET